MKNKRIFKTQKELNQYWESVGEGGPFTPRQIDAFNDAAGFTQQELNVLAKWCDEQREAKRQGKLTQDQIERLDAIGFDWNFNSRIDLN